MNKKRCYISIPVTGVEEAARERVADIKRYLSGMGYESVSPFDVYHGKDASYEDALCENLRALLGCDAVYFAEGYEKSTGCMIEYSAVRHLNTRRRINSDNVIRVIIGYRDHERADV